MSSSYLPTTANFDEFFTKLCADPSFDDAGDGLQFDDCELSALREAHSILLERGDVRFEHKYGAALLRRQRSDDISIIHLHVIGLDGWEMSVHGDGVKKHVSEPTWQPKVQPVGDIDASRWERFICAFDEIKAKVASRSGEARHADNSNGGHQMTPACIAAIARNAVKAANTPPDDDGKEADCDAHIYPKGGFTDVGMHTGGEARDTGLPLRVSVLYSLLQTASHLLPRGHELAMATFQVRLSAWHAERVVNCAVEQGGSGSEIYAAMLTLVSACRQCAALAESQLRDVRMLMDRFEAARVRLDAYVNAAALAAADKYELVPPVDEEFNSFPSPSIKLPANPSCDSSQADADALRTLASENLQWTCRLTADPDEKTPFASALEWFGDSFAAGKLKTADGALSALAEVEALVFRATSRLQCDCDGNAAGALCEDEAAALCSLVDKYREFLSKARRDNSISDGLLKTVLASKEALVVWSTFCLLHSAARIAYPLLKSFAVSPDYHDLEHLVLPDRASVDAMAHVAKYLRSASQRGLPVIFSGRIGELPGTHALADAVAASDNVLAELWQAEQHAAAARQQQRWSKILSQQAECRRLHVVLADEERWLAELTNIESVARAEYEYHETKRCRLALEHASSAVWSQQTSIASTKDCLETAQKAPAPLLQPLPLDVKLGKRATFYAHCPVQLKRLARWSYECYQVLLLEVLAVAAEYKLPATPVNGAPDGYVDFLSFHDKHNPERKAAKGVLSVSQSFLDFFVPGPPKKIVHTTNVEGISSPSDGVWHMPGFEPLHVWQGGPLSPGRVENPFLTPRHARVVAFTERVPERSLQWALVQPGFSATAATRGNEAPARQDDRPGWLSKAHYLAFCALRAFPHQQVRKLAAQLHDGLLQLGRRTTHLLILQSLFHVGELSDDCAMSWKVELLGGESEGVSVIASELERLTTAYQDQPRAHLSVLALGRIASYLSGFDGHSAARCWRCALRLSDIALQWAQELDVQAAAADDAADVLNAARLRASQHCYLTIALTCFGTSGVELDAAAAAKLCLLRAWMHATEPLLGQVEVAGSLNAARVAPNAVTADCDDGEHALAATAQAVMAARVRRVTELLDDAALSAAVRSVLHSRLPDRVAWSTELRDRKGRCMSCFEATLSDGSLISINVLNGIVLFNGLPPGHLPATIVSHPLYVRTFGKRNCTVVPDAQLRGGLATTRPLAGRDYSFFLTPVSGELIVLETQRAVDGMPARTFRLLDCSSFGAEQPTPWAASLPPRLQQMHSHWLAADMPTKSGASAIIFRPIHFAHRDTQFLLSCGVGAEGKRAQCALYRVPSELAKLHAERLAHVAERELLRMLALPEPSRSASCVRVLTKLERVEFIEAYVSPASCTLVLTLPRFCLEFELRDGAFFSVDYRGYKLAERQQLSDTLRGFAEYVILENATPHAAEMIGRPLQRIIVRRARVVGAAAFEDDQLTVTTHVPSDGKPGARLHAYVFDVHPRFHILTAADVCSRLQLAALYAATGTLLPEPRTGMTGGEHALELARQCWQNKPLSAEERRNLEVLASFAHSTPALALVCDDLCRSSRQLDFLYEGATTDGAPAAGRLGGPLFTEDACVEYMLRLPPAPRNIRHRLTADEEQRCLGSMLAASWPASWHGSGLGQGVAAHPAHDSDEQIQVPRASHAEDLMRWVEGELVAMVSEAPPRQSPRPFPLHLAGSTTAIGEALLDELRDSWAAHESCPSFALGGSFGAAANEAGCSVRAIASAVRRERTLIEADILGALSPTSTSFSAVAFRARRAANEAPIATPRDLVRASWDPPLLCHFNRLLSPASVEHVHAAILAWMQLCVLEDRLSRIISHLAEGDASSVDLAIREMRIRRAWRPEEHPKWLAFEVEGGIQVRPDQYAVIRDLLDNPLDGPGAIAQLNMGLGKTRVIVPCLILHWGEARASGSASAIVRLHFLSQLIDEAADHLHRSLTASLLNCKLFRMPFCRDVELTERRTCALRESLLRCQSVGGALIVAPEHRLSMELKEIELGMSSRDHGRLCVQRGLGALRALSFINVFDESDEILGYKRQLIYAVGAHDDLQAGDRRWQAISTLLRLLRRDTGVRKLLVRDETATWTQGVPLHQFDEIRLLTGHRLDAILPQLREQLVRAIFAQPPRHMLWLSQLDQQDMRLRDQLVAAIIDSSVSLEEAAPMLASGDAFPACALHDVLSLRGLLAYGVLDHALQKRHRVEFGVARGMRKKRLAVPFVAAGTPSARSEFSQPDVALTFTFLAYYADGLLNHELRQTFEKLLTTGPVAQRETFAEWFLDCTEEGRSSLDKAERESIDSIEKIDLSNGVQFGLLERAFSHSMLVIDFFLQNVVLPAETAVFAHHLLATPWHLCAGAAQQVGFSGTNDLSLLMPLAVKQASSSMTELRATNGLMISRLLEYAVYEQLPMQAEVSVAEALAAHAVRNGLRAIIDVGALMAGLSNEKVASLLADALTDAQSPCRGVTFFSTSKKMWCVLDSRSRRQWPLRASPIAEREAFCFFDESRCRGADLKLELTAVALLTLSPLLSKSALMQGAGRMRGLGFGQRLRIVAQADVDVKMRSCAGLSGSDPLTVAHVLDFVTTNTATLNALGLPQYVRHGAHFATTDGVAAAAVLDDHSTLDQMYSGANAEQKISLVASRILDSAAARHDRVAGESGTLNGGKRELLRRLLELAGEFGDDVRCMTSTRDDEAEREVEKEVDEEEEEEIEVARTKPLADIDWTYAGVLDDAHSPEQLPEKAGVLPIELFLSKDTAPFAEIGWPERRVYVTRNFATTVEVVDDSAPAQYYWRAVDGLILFPNGKLVLLSEREYDALLQLHFKKSSSMPRHGASLINFAFLRAATTSVAAGVAVAGTSSIKYFDEAAIAAVQLFAGETTFDSPARRTVLSAMIKNSKAACAARSLLAARGTLHLLNRSDLEAAIYAVESGIQCSRLP